jgi:hypothetical protein
MAQLSPDFCHLVSIFPRRCAGLLASFDGTWRGTELAKDVSSSRKCRSPINILGLLQVASLKLVAAQL